MKQNGVKPYIARIKQWKIRNMVRLYLEARDLFKKYRNLLRKGNYLSFERMREICDILWEIKEDHHLIYKRLLDPKKNKFEKAPKYLPASAELEFINNAGLLFHKMMVARELKYLLEHYFEDSDVFQKNKESLQLQLRIIEELFDDGIQVLQSLIKENNTNMLLLTLMLENTDLVRKHFGKNVPELVSQFGNGKGLDTIYCDAGKYYIECGRIGLAKQMLRDAVKKNKDNGEAKKLLEDLAEQVEKT